jgi:hypothetical protein
MGANVKHLQRKQMSPSLKRQLDKPHIPTLIKTMLILKTSFMGANVKHLQRKQMTPSLKRPII